MEKVKGWKNAGKSLKCKDFQFVVGESYTQKGEIKLCGNGFHFHENRFDIFKYYTRESVVLEVEASGQIITGDDKSVCSDIKIVRILSEDEILDLCNLKKNIGLHNSGDSNSGDRNSGDSNSGDSNSGDRNSGDSNSGYSNSGYWNSGDRNSGDRNSGYSNSGYSNSGYWNSGYSNSGDRNSGYWNSGDRNSGDWNLSDRNNGYFNTNKIKTVMAFNKPCSVKKWENAIKPSFIFFSLTSWVDESNMSEQDKIDHPEFYCQKGYLKTLDYKKAWEIAWDNKLEGDVDLLEKLPNFNWKVFTKISGIKKP